MLVIEEIALRHAPFQVRHTRAGCLICLQSLCCVCPPQGHKSLLNPRDINPGIILHSIAEVGVVLINEVPRKRLPK